MRKNRDEEGKNINITLIEYEPLDPEENYRLGKFLFIIKNVLIFIIHI